MNISRQRLMHIIAEEVVLNETPIPPFEMDDEPPLETDYDPKFDDPTPTDTADAPYISADPGIWDANRYALRRAEVETTLVHAYEKAGFSTEQALNLIYGVTCSLSYESLESYHAVFNDFIEN